MCIACNNHDYNTHVTSDDIDCPLCLAEKDLKQLLAQLGKLKAELKNARSCSLNWQVTAQDRLDELDKLKWIKVSEGLPKDDYGNYLVIRQGYEYEASISYYLADVPCNGGKHGWERGAAVTHWMFLPEPKTE